MSAEMTPEEYTQAELAWLKSENAMLKGELKRLRKRFLEGSTSGLLFSLRAYPARKFNKEAVGFQYGDGGPCGLAIVEGTADAVAVEVQEALARAFSP